MLPDRNGLENLPGSAGRGHTVPIVMLTAKGDDVDRNTGLEIGADDYLPKPCNPRELVRVSGPCCAVIRLNLRVPSCKEAAAARFGKFTLRPASRVLEQDGKPINLTTGEFAVLYALVSHPGETLSRERLLALARAGSARIPIGASDVRDVAVAPDYRNRSGQAPLHNKQSGARAYVFVPDDAQ